MPSISPISIAVPSPGDWVCSMRSISARTSIFATTASGSPFEYETIRFLYVRKLLIEDAGLHKHEPPKKRDPDLPAGE